MCILLTVINQIRVVAFNVPQLTQAKVYLNDEKKICIFPGLRALCDTWTKNQNQVFMFGLYIFDLSAECLPQHFRHGLHQIWQIDELFRARLKL